MPMLVLDFVGVLRRGVVMDDDTDDLVSRLCTRIGMIMEDASVIALTIGHLSRDERSAAIAQLDLAATNIATLTNAAKAIVSSND